MRVLIVVVSSLTALFIGGGDRAHAYKPCTEGNKTCYMENLRATTAAATKLVNIAHEFERVSDALMTGGNSQIGQGLQEDLKQARAAYLKIAEHDQLMVNGYWGFNYKSAADKEIHHWRLEQCEHAAVESLYAVNEIIRVKSNKGSDEQQLKNHAVDVAILLDHCELALRVNKRVGPFREFGRREASRCTEPSATHCILAEGHAYRFKILRETRDIDHAKFPSKP